MLVVILILSSIFIIVAFSVTENNAKYLLSGYNTMSEEEQQNFDIQSYIPYFKKFHLVLGISLLIVSLLLYYYVDSDWCGIFLGAYPILAYTFFIWKGKQIENNDFSTITSGIYFLKVSAGNFAQTIKLIKQL